MAGEGLGLAYQASKPIEDRSYDIIKEQLAYIEAKKGAAEAAKRQAELESRKLTDKFLQANRGVLKWTEVEGYYQKDSNKIINQVAYLTTEAGRMVGEGDIVGGHALVGKLESSLSQGNRLIKLFSHSAEQAAQAVSGDAKFVLDPMLNKDFVRKWENIRAGNSSMGVNSTADMVFSQLNDEGETETMSASEAFAVLSGGLISEVPIGEWGLSFLETAKNKIITGGKYDKTTRVCYTCDNLPQGIRSIKDRATESFEAESSKENPLLEFKKFVMQNTPDEKYNVEMSDEDYNTFRDDWLRATVGNKMEEMFSDENDRFGYARLMQQMRNDDARLALDKAKFANTKAQQNKPKTTQTKNQKAGYGGAPTPLLDAKGNPLPHSSSVQSNTSSVGAAVGSMSRKGQTADYSRTFPPTKLTNGREASGWRIENGSMEFLVAEKDGSTGYVPADTYLTSTIGEKFGIQGIDEFIDISYDHSAGGGTGAQYNTTTQGTGSKYNN